MTNFFPKSRIKLRHNKNSTPWTTRDIAKSFGELCKPLHYLFNLSFEKTIFPDNIKIAKVTPIFEAGNNTELVNYGPISVLPCLSKTFERVMYNCL